MRGLYAILDHPDPHAHDPAAHAGALLAGGACCLQLRAKALEPAERRAVALAVAPIAQAHGVPFVINDDVELALAGIRGVTGLHLGQEDVEALAAHGRPLEALVETLHRRDLIVGLSTHDLEQVAEVRGVGLGYIGFGPVFATASKKNPDPIVGVEGVERASQLSDVPVVAIGGIDLDGARACASAGASAVAVISGLRRPQLRDIRRAATEFTRCFDGVPHRS